MDFFVDFLTYFLRHRQQKIDSIFAFKTVNLLLSEVVERDSPEEWSRMRDIQTQVKMK